ncbi:MAG: SH3 domain-containing protein [Candidatus Omnitrophota bacterium]
MPKGPLLLTSCTEEMLTPEFWIRHLQDPDNVILTPNAIQEFNQRIYRWTHEAVDVFKIPKLFPGDGIRRQLELEFQTLRNRILYDRRGQRVPAAYFDETLKPIIPWEEIPKHIEVRWGVAVQSTSVRALPTDMLMIEAPEDVEFDQLQFTLIKLWTPVAVYAASSDGQWLYVHAPYARGWVKAADIAFFPKRELLRQAARPDKDFLVVTGKSVAVYSDPVMQTVELRPVMGTVIPLASTAIKQQLREGTPGKSSFVVRMPYRKADGTVYLEKAYIDTKSDVSYGYLAYTQRHVIQQAFKLLGVRYGWGGMYNGWDCSGFTHDVFLTFGFAMPRNSKPQAYVGTQIDHFEAFHDLDRKDAAIRAAVPAITLLRMSKHMMLYLGEIDGHFYAIHSTWAERISMTSDEKRRINQVVVSDLGLNGNSYVGSLFDRILDMNEINLKE